MIAVRSRERAYRKLRLYAILSKRIAYAKSHAQVEEISAVTFPGLQAHCGTSLCRGVRNHPGDYCGGNAAPARRRRCRNCVDARKLPLPVHEAGADTATIDLGQVAREFAVGKPAVDYRYDDLIKVLRKPRMRPAPNRDAHPVLEFGFFCNCLHVDMSRI